MPKVSVVIPVYNRERYIAACLDSVLGQTMADFEMVVVDDGSTDGSLGIVRAYAAVDRRIVVVSQENSGKPAIARNAGVARASGEYLSFLDSDDLYEPDKLRRQSALLDRCPRVNLVFSDLFLVDEGLRRSPGTYLGQVDIRSQGQPLGQKAYLCGRDFYRFMTATCTAVQTQTVMVRRSRLLAEQEWFPEDLTIGEDIDLWFRLAKGGGLIYINEPLASYRLHPAGITACPDRFYLGSVQSHARNYARAKTVLSAAERKRCRARIAGNLFHLGYYWKTAGNHRKAGGAYLASFSWAPSWRTVLALAKNLGAALGGAVSPVGSGGGR